MWLQRPQRPPGGAGAKEILGTLELAPRVKPQSKTQNPEELLLYFFLNQWIDCLETRFPHDFHEYYELHSDRREGWKRMSAYFWLLLFPTLDFSRECKDKTSQTPKYTERFQFRNFPSHGPQFSGRGGEQDCHAVTNIPIKKMASEVDFPYCCSIYLGMKENILTNALNCITLITMKSM